MSNKINSRNSTKNKKKEVKKVLKRAEDEEDFETEEEVEEEVQEESEEENDDDNKDDKQNKDDEDDNLDEDNLDDDKKKDDGKKDDDDGCLYNFTKNLDEEEEEEDIGLTDEDVEIEKIKVVEKITKPFLTKYERVRALGARAKQLSMGAKPMLKGVEGLSAKEVAKLELENKVLPFIIERPLPNGKVEVWNINELIINN